MQRPESDPREDAPAHHLERPFHVAPCRPAAVVAHAVDDQPGLQAPGEPAHLNEAGADLRNDPGIVPEGLAVDEHLLPGERPVTVQVLLPRVPAAVIVIFDVAVGVDLRHVRTVAEGVRRKIDIQALYAPDLFQVLLCVFDMPEQRFPGGHVFVALDPGCGGHFPASLRDPRLDLLHHCRIILFHDLIDRSLRLREAEVRILVHDVQDRAERGQRDRDRLIEAPHPVHVDVRVRREDQLVLLRRRLRRRKQPLRLLAGPVGQHALFRDAGKQKVKGLRERRVKGTRIFLRKMQHEFQLGKDPDVCPARPRDARLLLQRRTHRKLKRFLLPTAADRRFQAKELLRKCAHDDLLCVGFYCFPYISYVFHCVDLYVFSCVLCSFSALSVRYYVRRSFSRISCSASKISSSVS